MQKYYRPLLGALLFLAVLGAGVFIGTQVRAGSIPDPGSADDPLVAKSYVDKEMAARIRQLESQVAALKEKADTLQKALGISNPATDGATREDSSRGGSTGAKGNGKVTGQLVRLREGPGTNYRILREVAGGTSLTVLQSQGEWYQVKLGDGLEGWMLGEYVQLQ